MDNTIKSKLYDYCVAYAQERIDSIGLAIKSASESQDSETKSSAGDKHETGRAMLQLEQENNAAQLQEAIKLKEAVLKIKQEVNSDMIIAGSMVSTNKGMFYISISIGKINIEGNSYFVVSPVSPIGKMLLGLRKGNAFDLNGQHYRIENVY